MNQFCLFSQILNFRIRSINWIILRLWVSETISKSHREDIKVIFAKYKKNGRVCVCDTHSIGIQQSNFDLPWIRDPGTFMMRDFHDSAVMLCDARCWWQDHYVGNFFVMLVSFPESVTNISYSSPTNFVSNIRRQHRCNPWYIGMIHFLVTAKNEHECGLIRYLWATVEKSEFVWLNLDMDVTNTEAYEFLAPLVQYESCVWFCLRLWQWDLTQIIWVLGIKLR